MDVSFDYSGRVAIVTGAARGVGRSLVAAFATSGARVLAADRDPDGLAVTCQAHDPAQVSGTTADIRTAEGAAGIVSAAVAKFGTLDFCVNNAAVAPHAGLLEERAEVWDTVPDDPGRGPRDDQRQPRRPHHQLLLRGRRAGLGRRRRLRQQPRRD
jgi:NAD(P)-dependent dehydrogenase (short-subunit alcohol dehydrogenase family)